MKASCFRSWGVFFFTLTLLSFSGIGSAEERLTQNITEGGVAAMISKAQPLIEEITGMKFKEKMVFKLVDREYSQKAIADEVLPLYKILMKNSSDDLIARQVETTAALGSQLALGKYSVIKKEFLVIPENIKSVLKLLDVKDSEFQDFVFLVVAHEMVHALDDQYFDLQKNRTTMDGVESISAFAALCEGHAVYVVNKIAERLNIPKAANDLSVKSAAGITDANDRMQAQILYSTYIKGSEFIDAITKKKGLPGVAEAFVAPPSSTRQIMNPEEYLNPSAATKLDCSKLLKNVSAILPTQGMQTESGDMGTMVLGAMLVSNGISEDEANAVAKDCLSGAAVMASRQTIKPKMFVAMTLNFASGESAGTMLAMSRRSDKVEEAQFKAKLNSTYAVVKESELKLDGFDSARYRLVEKKINDIVTMDVSAEGISGSLYVVIGGTNMQTEITEDKVSEILTALIKEREKML
jgi:hypothetical protein